MISVIVPVYNVEQYIDACMQSLENQLYTEYEVIVIDDGSTDASSEICMRYAAKNPKIKYFRQENKGLSAARNEGVAKSAGELLCFVDADDFVEKEYLKLLYENMVLFHADISICGFLNYPSQKVKEKNSPVLLEKEQMLYDLTTTGANNRCEYLVIACNKLFRREIVEQTPFPIGKWHEDEFTVHHYITMAKRVVYTEKKLYNYRRHESGITGRKQSEDIRHLDLLEALEDRIDSFPELKGSELYQAILVSYIDNATILYLMQQDKKIKRQWKKMIFPKIKRMLKEKKSFLSQDIISKYRLFLIAPERYKRKYWC